MKYLKVHGANISILFFFCLIIYRSACLPQYLAAFSGHFTVWVVSGLPPSLGFRGVPPHGRYSRAVASPRWMAAEDRWSQGSRRMAREH